MMNIAIATTELSRLHGWAYTAISAAKSETAFDVERCCDVLRYLKRTFDFSVNDLWKSEALSPLADLRDHENPKIRMEADDLFNTWMRTLFPVGRTSNPPETTCNNKAKVDVVKVCSELKKKKKNKKEDILAEAKNPRKSVPATSRLLLMKKKKPSLKASEKHCPVEDLKKNSAEMLELFEMAKKSADVANAKGLLAARAETSLCVDTLSLLLDLPISSTATETRQIMERLERLTKHKDRKICNAASALVCRWSQSIKDQQQ